MRGLVKVGLIGIVVVVAVIGLLTLGEKLGILVDLSGKYINQANPNMYLVLEKDGGFVLASSTQRDLALEYDRYGNLVDIRFVTVHPLTVRGEWETSRGKVILYQPQGEGLIAQKSVFMVLRIEGNTLVREYDGNVWVKQ
jgi:hypothetical protein